MDIILDLIIISQLLDITVANASQNILSIKPVLSWFENETYSKESRSASLILKQFQPF